MVEQLWYVAYGSNLRLARFQCYLAGGRPEGGARDYPGCRDPSDPEDMTALALPGRLYFAGNSGVWGGGMAFYDPDGGGVVAARAYLVTLSQFSDVAAQEMRRPPGLDLDLSATGDSGQHKLGPGLYESVVSVGTRAGLPMLTITAGTPDKMTLAAPSRPYIWSIAAGLRESHGWSPRRIGEYLEAAAGVAPQWAAQRIEAVAREPTLFVGG